MMEPVRSREARSVVLVFPVSLDRLVISPRAQTISAVKMERVALPATRSSASAMKGTQEITAKSTPAPIDPASTMEIA